MANLEELLYKDYKPDPKQVGSRIKEVRMSLGYSMSEFATHIDKNARSGTVSNWETGKNLPNNKRLKKISELGNISLLYLLKGEKSMSDFSEDELDEFITKNKITIFNTLYKNTRLSEIQENFDKIYNDSLTDWQIELLNTSFKFILAFPDNNDGILSLFNSILDDSRVIFLEQYSNKKEPHTDYIASSVDLEENLSFILDQIKLK